MTELSFELSSLVVLAAGLLLGGVLKGATGAGLPIIAVPFTASVFDIRFAVILLVVPIFFSNLWQIVKYRNSNIEPVLTRRFALAGALGAGLGTGLLAALSLAVLNLLAASIVVVYVLLRLIQPSFKLPVESATRLAYPVGTVAGSLQGALGLSAPVSVTFIHSVKLGREPFIFTMSAYFAVMSIVQVPVQLWLNLTSLKLILLSFLAIIPILIGLPIGERIGKHMSAEAFDRTIFVLLIVLAMKLIFDGVSAF